MALGVVDVNAVELENVLEPEGFWHRGTELGPALGAQRIGAAVYEARQGLPIWPFHYHYPQEEWLYVLEGAPVLRDLTGRRALRPGDLVCFPRGHRGAHTVEGPGRLVIFDCQESTGPRSSVYVDSDKISIGGGEEQRRNALLLPRDANLSYWSGEGEPSSPAPVWREEDPGERVDPVGLGQWVARGKPTLEGRSGIGCEGPIASLSAALGSDQLAGFALELAPGEDFGPYRYEYGRESWLFVLGGVLTVRDDAGERTLGEGEIACAVEGPSGGRLPRNDGVEPARALIIATTGFPSAVAHPDIGGWVLRPNAGAPEIWLRDADPRERS